MEALMEAFLLKKFQGEMLSVLSHPDPASYHSITVNSLDLLDFDTQIYHCLIDQPSKTLPGKHLLPYDHEPRVFKNLKELGIEFQPSYPFSENIDEGDKYLDKRCPAWCDRILMTEAGHKQVVDSPLGCMYNMMAKGMCVGDHKPIYLFFTVASTTPMRQLPDDNLAA